MLAGIHCRLSLLRMKIRRALDHHRIQFLFQQLSVTAQAGKSSLLRHLELGACLIHPVWKIVCQGNHVVAAVFAE